MDKMERVKGFIAEDVYFLREFGPVDQVAELRRMGGWRRVVSSHYKAVFGVDPSEKTVAELRHFAQTGVPVNVAVVLPQALNGRVSHPNRMVTDLCER